MKELGVSDTAGSTHEYCIDWQEDQLTWSVDGKVGRTQKRSDSWNATAGRFDYPQTPSRVMLSLWPAGLPSNGKGTIDWAGGEIDWNSKYMTNGMYGALVTEVTVDCYDAPSGIKSTGSKSYKYTDKNPTNNTVEITDDFVILQSLMDTGDNPGSPSSSAASKSATAKPTKAVNMVPGGNPGGGARQESAVAATNTASPTGLVAPGDSSSGNSGSGNLGGSSGGSSSNNEWSQGKPNTGAGSSLEPALGKVGGSAIAIVFAIFGLLVL